MWHPLCSVFIHVHSCSFMFIRIAYLGRCGLNQAILRTMLVGTHDTLQTFRTLQILKKFEFHSCTSYPFIFLYNVQECMFHTFQCRSFSWTLGTLGNLENCKELQWICRVPAEVIPLSRRPALRVVTAMTAMTATAPLRVSSRLPSLVFSRLFT